MNAFLRKRAFLVVLALLSVITWIISRRPHLVETFYSTGIYPYIGRTERWLFGWLPFSLGDLLYAAAFIWAIIKVAAFIRVWRRRQLTYSVLGWYGRKLLQVCLCIYLSFSWLWGLNYQRLGSAYQMQLTFAPYSNEELIRLTDTLESRMLPVMMDSSAFLPYAALPALRRECVASYQSAAHQYPFLYFEYSSAKPHSLYTIGNYLGFLGYLNPFTAEAQLNTTIPLMLKPAVMCHEMGHQTGYASESEANFIAFVTCRQSQSPAFRYSIYFDMYGYAVSDLYYRDSAYAKKELDRLPSKIKRDRWSVRQFFRQYKNPVTPLIDWFYDKYLKLNSQPKGRASYNEVVGWMIAYAKRYGWDKL
jgi:hypothetical protein